MDSLYNNLLGIKPSWKDDIKNVLWEKDDKIGYLKERKHNKGKIGIYIEAISLKDRKIEIVKELSVKDCIDYIKTQTKREDVINALNEAKNADPETLYDLLYLTLETLYNEKSVSIEHFINLEVVNTSGITAKISDVLSLKNEGNQLSLFAQIRQGLIGFEDGEF